MTLIDLDELKKFPVRLDNYDKEHGSEEFVLGIEAVLEYAENLTKYTWVPCSEKLPEDSEDVLVYFEYFRYNDYDYMYRLVDIGSYSPEYKNQWFIGNGRKDFRVIAWMPIPKVPKDIEERGEKNG